MDSVIFLVCCIQFFFLNCESFPNRPYYESLNAPITNKELNIVALNSFATKSQVNAASSKAIQTLLSTCAVGFYASKVHILDKNALSTLSKIVFNIFQPCLLFVNVALTISKMRTSMNTGAACSVSILLIASCVQALIGYLIGAAVSWILYGFADQSDDKKQLIACSTFANIGNLPLVFVDSLFKSHPDTTLLPKSLAYISLYLMLGSPLFWVGCSSILRNENNSNDRSNVVVIDSNIQNDAVSVSSNIIYNKSSTQVHQYYKYILLWIKSSKINELMKRVLVPPVMGSMCGLIVGSNFYLNKLFLQPNYSILNPFYEGLRTLSAGCLPSVLLILAASLSSTNNDPERPLASTIASTNHLDKSNEVSSVSGRGYKLPVLLIKRVLALCVTRYFFMPIFTLHILKFVCKHVPLIAADKVLVFILLLQSCMPSAQNTVTILQMNRQSDAAESMARTLLAVYMIGVPAMSYWLPKILTVSGILSGS